MAVKQAHYEELLAEYSDHLGAIALLKQHRPYLEMVPSMRRPEDSVITIPLPVIRMRTSSTGGFGGSAFASQFPEGVITNREAVHLPCDVAILMSDPEWQVKTGPEICIFIYRPQEDFSDFLGRWRQTQVLLDRGYEWLMPSRYQHVLSEASDEIYPLFVVFPETPERIRRGLRGASLPFVIQRVDFLEDWEELPDTDSRSVMEVEE
jgi:hypothetical protein